MNDSEFMLKLLSDGQPHTTLEIIAGSLKKRGCGITPHSRASDLRKRGHHIDCEYGGKRNGRPIWIYTLRGSLPELPLSLDPSPETGTANAHDPIAEGRGSSESEQDSLFQIPARPEWA